MNKLKDFLKSTKNKKITAILFAIIGICLIGITYIPTESTTETDDADYGQILESRTKEIIEAVTGENTTEVMITFKNTFIPASENVSPLTSTTLQNNSSYGAYTEIPMPDIAGVMIVCSSLSDKDDFLTIKQAVSTCLNIPQSKIYIIGGKTDNEKIS